jgi:ClpP class serine protease
MQSVSNEVLNMQSVSDEVLNMQSVSDEVLEIFEKIKTNQVLSASDEDYIQAKILHELELIDALGNSQDTKVRNALQKLHAVSGVEYQRKASLIELVETNILEKKKSLY